MNLTEEETRAILKQYLDKFYCYFSEDEEKQFSETIPDSNTLLLRGEFEVLKKAVCYYLLKDGRRHTYYFLKSNDVLDKMLSDHDDPLNEDYTFKDIEEVPLLIIYHPRIWKKNKIMWETLNYLVTTRELMSKKTLVITDARSLSDDHGSFSCDNDISFWCAQTTRPQTSTSGASQTNQSLYGD